MYIYIYTYLPSCSTYLWYNHNEYIWYVCGCFNCVFPLVVSHDTFTISHGIPSINRKSNYHRDPLVIQYHHGTSPGSMEKSTISTAMFHSYGTNYQRAWPFFDLHLVKTEIVHVKSGGFDTFCPMVSWLQTPPPDPRQHGTTSAALKLRRNAWRRSESYAQLMRALQTPLSWWVQWGIDDGIILSLF